MNFTYRIICLLALALSSLTVVGQDTLRYEDFIKNLKKEKPIPSEEKDEKEPSTEKRETPKQDTRTDDVADTKQAFGVLDIFATEALTSSLFLIDQGYAGIDDEGEEIIVGEDGYRPIEVGVLVDGRLLTLERTLRPWETDPMENYDDGAQDLLYYRQLISYTSRWKEEDSYLSEATADGALSYYDNLKADGTNLELSDRKSCDDCILLLATVNRGDDPRSDEVNLRYQKVSVDWEDEQAEVDLPRTTETVIGGVLLDVVTQTGTINFRVAGLLDEDSAIVVKTPTSSNRASGKDKKSKTSKQEADDDDRGRKKKKSKKKKKKKRS